MTRKRICKDCGAVNPAFRSPCPATGDVHGPSCPTCEEIERNGGFGPPHKASEFCQSGKHEHCSCDRCF